jgi:hypothetical protein
MRRRKAARPTADKTAREPRRVDQLGGKIGSEATSENPALQSVYSGQTCLGFLLNRGKLGIEAFDAAEHSPGIFPTLKEAGDAVSHAAGGAQ